jgi:protein involved in polysaccharide export with SLBB domain
MTLERLVELAGGTTPRANLARVTVFRKPVDNVWDASTDFRYPISCSLDPPGKPSSVALEPSDSVFVPLTVGFVRVGGQVKNPGYFMYVSGRDVRFYIDNAGGFTSEANQTEVIIFSRVAGVSFLVSPDAIVYDGDELTVNRLAAVP